ncbi:DUF5518 domain-containing protein [Natronococcus jeotgali]|uniref:DUF5518 domain-containing protein n=1 Tax=Natronococcus jeotgali DSM 18795 TaxID=1227498 RepID=L9WME5_9EURY|nr:DUF5518 domain-containing protein [Natronococcus jeotgali]ELY50552.1 hypothetical protein C492_22292 [Natronococcus jeotgali DSM 18795]
MAPNDPPPTLENSTPPPVDEQDPGRDTSTALNAVIGGVVGIVLSFVPLSPVLGGTVAGYLEGGDTDDGLKVGAFAGLVALLPIALVGFFVLVLLVGGTPAAFGILGLVGLFFVAIYTVGLGALGGAIGVYVEDEF